MVIGITFVNVLVGGETLVYELIRKIEGVRDVYQVFGEFDFIVKIEVESLSGVNSVVDRIRGIHEVFSTQTIIGIDFDLDY